MQSKSISYPDIVTAEWLQQHPECIFVFGDNTGRTGYGGAAALRDEPNTYGFITKILSKGGRYLSFRPQTYKKTFKTELEKLKKLIESKPHTTFLISKIGAGLGNNYHIFELIICGTLKILEEEYSNVVLLEKHTYPRGI